MISIVDIAKHGYSAYCACCERIEYARPEPWADALSFVHEEWLELADKARNGVSVGEVRDEMDYHLAENAYAISVGYEAMQDLIASVH